MKLFDRFKYHGLFIKMFLVMVISILAIAATITYSTLRMSEQLFMDTFSITNGKVVQQVTNSFESFANAAATAANEVQQSGTIKSYLSGGEDSSLSLSKLYYNTSVQMDRAYVHVDDYELSLFVTGVNGRSYSTDRAYWPIAMNELADHAITKRSLQEPRRLLYQLDYSGEQPMIVLTKALSERTTDSVYGMFYMAVRESEFKKFYAAYASEGNDLLVMDGKGLILSSSRPDLIGQTDAALLDKAVSLAESGDESEKISWDDRDRLMTSELLPSVNMYVVNLVDEEMVAGQLIHTKAILMSSAVIVLVAVWIVFLISRRMTGSISRLVREISVLSQKDFQQYVTVGGSYEAKKLAYAFNNMLDELHHYVDELVTTQQKQRKAELEALQRQINPHFLYNTLASVKIMVQQGNKEKAAETINALISLLQHAVGNVEETIAVKDEVNNLKHYVFINQVRYGDRVQASFFTAPDCEELHIPKLMIQPFIENAFFHAFNAKKTGYIHIMIMKEKNQLVCEIVDNGDGMTVTETGQIPGSKRNRQLFSGIGVRNVHERLQLMFGETAGVFISSNPGEGTHVRLIMPVLEPDQTTKT